MIELPRLNPQVLLMAFAAVLMVWATTRLRRR